MERTIEPLKPSVLSTTDPKTETTEPRPEPSRTCPNCGALLLEQKCKLLCPNQECGYFMSCSDF